MLFLRFFILVFFNDVHRLIKNIFFHKGIESCIVDHEVINQAHSKAYQVNGFWVQCVKIDVQSVNNQITNNFCRTIGFGLYGSYKHCKVVNRLLFIAISDLSKDHEGHCQAWDCKQNVACNWIIFEVNRKCNKDKKNNINCVWDNLADVEEVHAYALKIGFRMTIDF
jgi:hypothetical protein